MKNKYNWEDIFHPKTLETLRNESLFKIKETYSSYYGLCFTLQKLTPEKVADYSFQIVVNDTTGKNGSLFQVSNFPGICFYFVNEAPKFKKYYNFFFDESSQIFQISMVFTRYLHIMHSFLLNMI